MNYNVKPWYLYRHGVSITKVYVELLQLTSLQDASNPSDYTGHM